MRGSATRLLAAAASHEIPSPVLHQDRPWGRLRLGSSGSPRAAWAAGPVTTPEQQTVPEVPRLASWSGTGTTAARVGSTRTKFAPARIGLERERGGAAVKEIARGPSSWCWVRVANYAITRTHPGISAACSTTSRMMTALPGHSSVCWSNVDESVGVMAFLASPPE